MVSENGGQENYSDATVSEPSKEIYAGIMDRFCAYCIDFLIFLIPVSIIIYGLSVFSGQGNFWGNAFVILIIGLIAYWLYFAYSESSSSQATLGKRVIKIKVVDSDGRISLRKSLIRNFFKILLTLATPFSLLSLLNAILIYYSDNKQAFHDYIAKTKVMKA